ncbi:MAG TPA: protease modulator HflC [Rhodospirillales bacterium]|nr:protease modulator HflC [Rhodospirillales bacterium]
MSKSRMALIIILALLAFVGFSSVYTVFQTEQALVLQFGKPKRLVSEPGLAFKTPLVENVLFYDKRVLDYDLGVQEIPTQDQKQVVVDAFTRYRIVDPLKFFQAAGNEFGMESRLSSILTNNLQAVFGDVPMAVVLTPKRADLMDTIYERVRLEGARYGIDVIDVRLKRVDLPEENSQAIYRQMQTQREQEARKSRAEGDRKAKEIRADADKQSTIIKATAVKKAEILMGEGEAEAQRIYNAAHSKDREFFDFWVSMNALREGLGGDTTRYIGPPSGDFFRFFGDITGKKKK